MKKLIGILLSSLFLVFPICANADIIGNVDLQASATYPPNAEAYFNFGGTPNGFGNWMLDYSASINGGPWVETFCAENAALTYSTQPYTVLTIDSSLNAFSLDSSRYLAAAAIAEYLVVNNLLSSPDYKGGAQVAIWDIIIDGTFNLADGKFRTVTTTYNDEALLIWNEVKDSIPTSSPWALAVNPTVMAGNPVGVEDYQNYLVRVPEPGILILLGIALSAVGLASRRRNF